MVKYINREILRQLEDLNKQQVELFETYHNESYKLQCKINELRNKMEEKK